MMQITLVLLLLIAVSVFSFESFKPLKTQSFLKMGKIADGVEFDTIAREWRLKWIAVPWLRGWKYDPGHSSCRTHR